MQVRPLAEADLDALVALWQAGGVGLGPEADRDEIAAVLAHGAPYFLVMVDADPTAADSDEAASDQADRGEAVGGEAEEGPGGDIVASIMGTYDGHRGRIKRAVVHPSRRGEGLGRRMVEELEARFLADGITELRLEVWASNEGALAFWRELGWEHLADIRYFQRSIG